MGGGCGRRTATMRMPFANLLALLLAGLLGFAGLPGAAWAHAVLTEAHPADGASLAEPPAEFVLGFNEPVTPVAVRLISQDGGEIADVRVEARDNLVIVTPRAPLAPGGYFLSYRVTSLDAHSVGATLRFGVGATAPGALGPATGQAGQPALAALTRWLTYVSALGAAGAALFLVLVRPPPPLARQVRLLAAGSAVAGLVMLVLRFGAAGLDLAGLPLASLLTVRPWFVASATSLVPASALAAAGLVPIMAARLLPGWAAAAGAVTVAASFALTGHAASAPPRLLTGPALWLHVLCAAYWFGALLPLLWCLRLPPAEADSLLRRFSRAATVAVVSLAVAGGGLAWIQLGGSAEALVGTDYGRRLLTKFALVAAMLALAAINRIVLTARVAAGRPDARWQLRLTIGADLALALGVLAVTATFPFSPPPRALAEDGSGISVVASGRGGQAILTLLPGRLGVNRLQAGVTDQDGAPISAREARFAWSLPSAGIEPIRVAATLPLPGVVVAEGIPIPQPGRWRLRLDLLIDDFTKSTYEGEIDVR